MFDWSFHHRTEGSGHLEAKTFGFCPLVPEFRCSTEMTFYSVYMLASPLLHGWEKAVRISGIF